MHLYSVYVALSLLASIISILYFLIGFPSNQKANIKKVNKYDIEDLTLIVPAYKEPMRSIRDIVRRYKGKVKIIFALSRNDPQLKAISRYLYSAGVKFIISGKGKKRAIKRALKEVNTPLVGLLDADSRISIQAIRLLLSKIDDSIGGIAPSVRPYKSKRPAFYYYKFYSLLADFNNRFAPADKAPILYGNFAIYKTELIKKFFRQQISHAIGDDKELPDFVLKRNKKAVIDRSVYVYTYAPNNWKQFYKMLLRWSRANFIISFERILNGLAMKRGLRYVFNVLFAILFPVITLILTITSFYINTHRIIFLLSHAVSFKVYFTRSFTKTQLTITRIILHIDPQLEIHTAKLLGKILFWFSKLSSLLYVFLVINVLFAIREIKRVKEALYALAAIPIMTGAALHALFTLWKVNSWESK
jgi:cellulose synthase/poly-beta-1,6-N-acetylglucosamine synthase-like glycosyltransferase